MCNEKYNYNRQTDRQTELTISDTKMLQGLSVLAMVFLHLFDRLDYANLYQPLLYFKGYPVVFYFAQLSDFCVMGFAFCSGYALIKLYRQYGRMKYIKSRLKSLFWLLVNFWIILFLFTIISIVIGNGKQIPGSVLEFMGNFTTVHVTYNGAWWYLFIYILLVVLSPIIFESFDKMPVTILALCSFFLYVTAYYVRFRMEGHGWLLEKYGTFGMTFFEFIIGYLCYRESWILKLRKWKDKKSPVVCSALGIILVVGMLLFHTLVIRSLFIAPVTGMTIVFLFTLWRKPVWVERMFMILGRHSTNIWLIHMFFYLCIFKNLVFKAKYPLLILAFMFGITIVVSTGINFVLGKLKRFTKGD